MAASCGYLLRSDQRSITTFSQSSYTLGFPIMVVSLLSLLLNLPVTLQYWCPTVQYVMKPCHHVTSWLTSHEYYFHTQAEVLRMNLCSRVQKRLFRSHIDYSEVSLVVMNGHHLITLGSPAACCSDRSFELPGFRAKAMLAMDGIKPVEKNSPFPDLALLSRGETLEECEMENNDILRKRLKL